MKLESLDNLSDDELKAAIEHAQTLLKQRDDDRKAKALEQARTLLASVGLSLKDVAAGKSKNGNGGAKHVGGHQYQHPTNKALTWMGTGRAPKWLRDLEAQGGKALEVGNA